MGLARIPLGIGNTNNRDHFEDIEVFKPANRRNVATETSYFSIATFLI
jgi:hypothetical protein